MRQHALQQLAASSAEMTFVWGLNPNTLITKEYDLPNANAAGWEKYDIVAHVEDDRLVSSALPA